MTNHFSSQLIITLDRTLIWSDSDEHLPDLVEVLQTHAVVVLASSFLVVVIAGALVAIGAFFS